jgi:tRNA(fMet)-specific endonuclease VapC
MRRLRESRGVSLETRGTRIGPMDMLIAGHALALDAMLVTTLVTTLVTGNVGEFGRVDGLRVENWLGRTT